LRIENWKNLVNTLIGLIGVLTAALYASPLYIESDEAWVWNWAVQYKKGKTDSLVFAKLAQIEAGSPVVLSQIPRAESSLLRLGYFSKNSEAKIYRIANRNRIVPVFDLTDATSNFAEATFAYDAESADVNWLLKVQLLNIAGTAGTFPLAAKIQKTTARWKCFIKSLLYSA